MNAPFPSAPPQPVPFGALTEAFPALRVTLELLGVEVGDEVLAVWRDRYARGRPVSSAVLEQLVDVAGRIAATAYDAAALPGTPGGP